ncbi:MAG: ribokinase [Deferribacteres bacterium]|nr:ribokinase [candidate division KSB1 bacterium]MCB9503989.1 ribokinase [Deferribacteres bacterium]
MKITVVGSSNTDMIIKVPRIPAPGETILGGEFFMAAGGKGANQAVAAARAGGQVTFVACVGDDLFGRQARDGFVTEGINTQYVFIESNTPSGVAEIFVAENGENSIAVASGANLKLSTKLIERNSAAITNADVLVVQLESPLETVAKAIEFAHKNNVMIILNPAPAQKLSTELLQKVTIITPNETEAELLTGIQVKDLPSAKAAAYKLHELGTSQVIITRGQAGAYVSSKEFTGSIPAFKMHAIDTTAAGDVFTGTLAVALAEQKHLKEAVYFASAASALSVKKAGAQPSIPTRTEIDTFLNTYF